MRPPLPSPLRRATDAALEATVVLSFSRIGSVVRSRVDGWSPSDRLAGDGQRVLITGANTGIGYATARRVLGSGARVHLLVRSRGKAERTVHQLEADLGRTLDDHASTDVADLLDLASVRDAAARLRADGRPLTALVHNAGAMFPERDTSIDGLERTYQVHVVAPFLLTALLRPMLAENAPARVVTVTSGGMYAAAARADDVDSPDGYRPALAYARAKRAQVSLTRAWQQHSRGLGVDHHVAHPGWVLTPGVEASLPRFRTVTGPVLRDPDGGADTIAWLTLAQPAPPGGALWHDRRRRAEHRVPWTRPTGDEVRALWDRVREDAGLTEDLQLRQA